MNKIGSSPPNAMPWPSEAGTEVNQLRRAITAHLSHGTVDNDVAPMMAELLARLEAFIAPGPETNLHAPPPPNLVNPPGPAETMAALGKACTKAQSQMAQIQGDAGQRLRTMLDVVEGHIAMKQEIVLRAGDGG